MESGSMEYALNSPPESEKNYKALVLDNGLNVILISDPETTYSAAAMTVRVGSSSDPPEAQGLAHLLEHMLCKGSKAYPHPNELNDFLSQYNGDKNAFTKMDFIMFHFNVLSVGFQGALQRFCESFISPLFKEDCLEAEITAIEHEFEAIRQTDRSRLDQLKGRTAPAEHPFNRFTWGNRESLSKLKNDKLVELLSVLFNKSFVGSYMSLVVLGKETLRVLKKWVEDYFGRIKQGPKFISNYVHKPGPIWKVDTLFLSKSAEDTHLLEITWNIPSISYLECPEQFLVIAFNHKGEGSLYSIFKKKGYLVSLEASSGDDDDGPYACTSVGRLFSLSLELTNLGREQVYDIVGFVYKYLQFLRDKDAPWIMDEFFRIRDIKFQCFDTYDIGSDPCVLTQQLAENMLHIPLQDAVCANSLNKSCTKESIDDFLKHFSPANMRLDLASKSFNGIDLVEPFFNTFYKEVKISPHLIDQWRNPCYKDACFQLPPRNQFLPTVVPLSDDGDETDDEDETESYLLVDESSIKLWHTRDESVPTFNFSVYCKIGDDLMSQALGVLYLHLLKDSLAPILSEGKQANLSTSITLSDKNKIEIKTMGFKENFQLYISEIWKTLTCFSPSFDSFATDKEIVGVGLNDQFANLLDHSNGLLLEVVSRSCYSANSMLNALKSIEPVNMINFIQDLRSEMFIEGVFFGDISRKEAINISTLFESIEIKPLPEDCRFDKREDIPLASEVMKCFHNTNDGIVRLKSDINSLATVCFQIGTKRNGPKNSALLHIFYSMIEKNISYWLRFKNNLGYLVRGEIQSKYGIKLLTISVVSSEHGPEYLLEQIRQYVKGLEEFLEGMEVGVFENHIKIVRNEYPDYHGGNMWDQITDIGFDPDFNKLVRMELEKIKKEDVIMFYRKYLVETSPNIRMLSLKIWGCNSY